MARTSSSNLPLSLSVNPQTSTNLLWTLASAPIILSPPPTPKPATNQLMYQPHLPHNYSCLLQVYEPSLLAPMQCFYIGETCCSLSDRMNGHRFTTTVLNPDLPVAIHTQSHHIPFQECWSVSIIHKLPDSTPDHIRHQFEIAYQLVLQSRHTPGQNIR